MSLFILPNVNENWIWYKYFKLGMNMKELIIYSFS